MCESCDNVIATSRTRRGFLAAIGGVGLVALLCRPMRAMALAEQASNSSSTVAPVEVTPGLLIHPRNTWGAKLPALGKLHPEEVKFLLVHHSDGTTDYTRAQVPGVIANIFLYQTSSRKKWPDTCYNFFVDRFGGVWEGRTGSLAGPVQADATAGSQGFAQLVCLLGDFENNSPTPEMIDGLSRLLGWLGYKYEIDLNQKHIVSFVSRGSNKWKKGAKVKARPISGHRDMTYTLCPGKHVYPLLDTVVPGKAQAFRATIA